MKGGGALFQLSPSPVKVGGALLQLSPPLQETSITCDGMTNQHTILAYD